MTKLSGWKMGCVVVAMISATTVGAPAQTFTTLARLNRANGANPQYESLVQGTDGNFYGTTYRGGPYRTACNGGDTWGTVFRVSPEGKLTTLYFFCSQNRCGDGSYPSAGLVLATDGSFYGTTVTGGDGSSCPEGCGTVFKITSSGKLTTLHSFDLTDGSAPDGGELAQDTNGNFYGTTVWGGSHTGHGCGNYPRCGTVFKITPNGTLTTLYSFCAQPNCTDGWYPAEGLVQAADGNFYGTTVFGGIENSSCPYGCGTIYKITAGGKLTTLYSFCAQTCDVFSPDGLIQGTDGNFYGFASGGFGGGVVFELTAGGALTTLYSFCSVYDCTDGFGPVGSLAQATDGNFYGATAAGGAFGGGVVFELTAGGALTTLYSFCSQPDCIDGSVPQGGLLQATNGNFYGTTYFGGGMTVANDPCIKSPSNGGCGTVFSLNTGLGPFVSFVRNPAKVGQTFGVLGYGLTGTTDVSLNGNPANFTVRSDTFLEATVPAGATTGYVTVTTPSGTLTSNVPFHVIP